jgi:hypothetical protein
VSFIIEVIVDPVADQYSIARNDWESPLLRLPADLRNRIYEIVIYNGTHEFFSLYQFHRNQRRRRRLSDVSNPKQHLVALLRVCRAIHSETALLPFSLNTCDFCRFEWLETYKDLLTQPQWAAIKKIEVRANILDCDDALDLMRDWQADGISLLQDIFPQVSAVSLRISHQHTFVGSSFQIPYNRFVEKIPPWLQGKGVGQVRVRFSTVVYHSRELLGNCHII